MEDVLLKVWKMRAIRLACMDHVVRQLHFFIVSKAAGITFEFDVWNKGWCQFASQHLLKVNALEPSVVFNIVCSVLQISKSLGCLCFQQILQ